MGQSCKQPLSTERENQTHIREFLQVGSELLPVREMRWGRVYEEQGFQQRIRAEVWRLKIERFESSFVTGCAEESEPLANKDPRCGNGVPVQRTFFRVSGTDTSGIPLRLFSAGALYHSSS